MTGGVPIDSEGVESVEYHHFEPTWIQFAWPRLAVQKKLRPNAEAVPLWSGGKFNELILRSEYLKELFHYLFWWWQGFCLKI